MQSIKFALQLLHTNKTNDITEDFIVIKGLFVITFVFLSQPRYLVAW